MDKIIRNPIAVRTRKAREATGRTQEEMAGLLDIPLERYNKYETRSALKQELIAKFCQLTGITEKWFLTGKGPMQSDIDPHLQELKSIYYSISEKARETFLEMGRLLAEQNPGREENS
jgi:transcriptional regulator with XRE-family HTH domain